jgi:hypothetical protein
MDFATLSGVWGGALNALIQEQFRVDNAAI